MGIGRAKKQQHRENTDLKNTVKQFVVTTLPRLTFHCSETPWQLVRNDKLSLGSLEWLKLFHVKSFEIQSKTGEQLY